MHDGGEEVILTRGIELSRRWNMRWRAFKLFPSTCVLLVLLLAGVIVLNCIAPLGWPWLFQSSPQSSDSFHTILEARGEVLPFLSLTNIACDLLVAIAIVVTPTFAWEW